MRKLVQRLFDINPYVISDSSRVQEFLDKMSRDNWEYCGQIGLYYVFKRWEEEPNVISGGSGSFYQPQPNPPSYGNGYGQSQYNHPTFQPQQYNPYSSNSNSNPAYNGGRYNPSQFGVRVNEGCESENPFNKD